MVERGDHADAATVLRPLIDTDLEAGEKAIVCVNLAVVSNHMGQVDTALGWYDYGMHYSHVFVAEEKAAYLVRQGRDGEALVLYESLFPELLSPEERQRITHNIDVLRAQG
jgi:predicted negative regulator of RcsB-dependent stress response